MNFFDNIADMAKESIKGNIVENVEAMFSPINSNVTEVSSLVGQTPQSWNSNIFDVIRTLSDTFILPIAGVILTFVMCYELIQMVIDKNNGHNFETFVFFKWIFKTVISVLIVTHAFDIIMGIFEISQNLINESAGSFGQETIVSLETSDIFNGLDDASFFNLLLMWIETGILKFGMNIMGIFIFLIATGRMLEIYLVVSVGAIPLATLGNNDMGQTGKNYIKTLVALAFQGFLIIMCIFLYSVLARDSLTTAFDFGASMWKTVGYTVLLCFMLFKTGSISKSIFGAH